jgi:hypothetical protein
LGSEQNGTKLSVVRTVLSVRRFGSLWLNSVFTNGILMLSILGETMLFPMKSGVKPPQSKACSRMQSALNLVPFGSERLFHHFKQCLNLGIIAVPYLIYMPGQIGRSTHYHMFANPIVFYAGMLPAQPGQNIFLISLNISLSRWSRKIRFCRSPRLIT